MLTSSQKKTTLFIAAVASAVFGGIQLVPIFASLNKTDPTPTPINTVIAPGGIAIAGNTINELPINNSSPVQVTINNGNPHELELLTQEIIEHQQQRQVSQTLETKLSNSENAVRTWQFKYFQSAFPITIEMLKDLATLQNYSVQKAIFDERWAHTIQQSETRRIYINDVLIHYGWAIEQNGFLRVTTEGLNLLKQSGINILPYAAKHSFSPSFNCDNADKLYEKLICSDEELSKLDVDMVRLFKHIQTLPDSDAKAINASQVTWRKRVRNVCTDRTCLAISYNERIKQLSLTDNIRYKMP